MGNFIRIYHVWENLSEFTTCGNKIALSANDDKRIILEDGISTLAHGHWRAGGKNNEK